jgi:hypothetical protein
MQRLVGLSMTVLALAACTQAPRVSPPAPKKVAANVAATADPTPSPAASTARLVAAPLAAPRRTALLDGLANAVAASRATRLTANVSDASGALGGSAASILSNNGSSIISDNGGGIISDNGGSVVSTNGSSLTSKTKRRLLSFAADHPASEAAMAGQAFHFTSETATLVYVVDFPAPDHGGYKAYEKQAYHDLPPERREEALVDDFAVDSETTTTNYQDDPTKVAIDYHMRKISSKRVPFADKLLSREIYQFAPTDTGFAAQTVGWEIAFDVAVPGLAGGADDKASFKAVAGPDDLEKVPADIVGNLMLPARVALTGHNDRGTYEGTTDNHGRLVSHIAHTSAAGVKTILDITNELDGSTRQAIELPDAKLRLVTTTSAKGEQAGELDDTSGATPEVLADVTWDADGVATIAFRAGDLLKARLF